MGSFWLFSLKGIILYEQTKRFKISRIKSSFR